MLTRYVVAVLFVAGALAWLAAPTLARAYSADKEVTLRGCVVERGPTSLTLEISKGERVTISTTRLKQEDIDDALADCVTINAVRDGDQLVAITIEAGDKEEEKKKKEVEESNADKKSNQ